MQIDSNIAALFLQKQLLLLVYSNYSDIIDDAGNILFKSFHLLNKIPKPIFCGDLNKILFSAKNFFSNYFFHDYYPFIDKLLFQIAIFFVCSFRYIDLIMIEL